MLYANDNKTNMLFKTLEGGEETISPYFEVERLIKRIPEDIENEAIEIFYRSKHRTGRFRILTTDLCDINVVAKICFSNHFVFPANYKQLVYGEIIEQYDKILDSETYSFEHKCLGWQNIDNKPIFLYDYTNLKNGYNSTCIRNVGQFSNGNESDYDKFLNKCVFNSNARCLAYSLAFTSVVASRLSTLKDLGVLIVGLSGRSTTGKTTMLKLMASVWGDTDDIKGTMILRNKGSEVGFDAQYSGLYGVPILFDDLDTNSKINIGDFVYDLSKGTQRIVAKNNGDCDFSRMGFSGLCAITSENPILSKTDQRIGLYARVIDLHDVGWTDSASISNEIKNCICTTYGHKGKQFAEFVSNISDEKLSEHFDRCYQIVLGNIENKDDYSERIAKKYAVIWQTIELLNNCFNLQFNTSDIMQIALNCEKEQQLERNKSKMAYDFILTYFFANKNKFDIKIKNGEFISKSTLPREGIAMFKDGVLDLCVPISTARQILNNNSFPQLDTYKKQWKEKGLTKCENSRTEMSNPELGRHFHFVYKDINLEAINNV